MQVELVDVATEIWKNLVDYIPSREREAAAEHFVSTLRQLDFSQDEIEQIAEADHYVNEVLDIEQEEDEYYDTDLDESEDGRY